MTTPERPTLPAKHPLRALAGMLDDHAGCRDMRPLADLGVHRLRDLVVFAAGLLDPTEARVAINIARAGLPSADAQRPKSDGEPRWPGSRPCSRLG